MWGNGGVNENLEEEDDECIYPDNSNRFDINRGEMGYRKDTTKN